MNFKVRLFAFHRKGNHVNPLKAYNQAT